MGAHEVGGEFEQDLREVQLCLVVQPEGLPGQVGPVVLGQKADRGQPRLQEAHEEM